MLFNKLTSLWKRGVKRAMKLQQKENKKLIKSVLSTPPTKARRAVTPVAVRQKKPAIQPKNRSAIIPPTTGKWLKSHQSSTILDGGVSANRMSYWLYLPNHAATSRLPLVVMLHGCAQTATQFAQSTRMNVLADKKGFAVLYPQRPAARDLSGCWHWYKKSVQQGGGEVKAIVGIVEEVVEKYVLDKRRIYIAGISAGASMANIVALNNPTLFAAVGNHSGPVFGAANSPIEGYSVMQRGAHHLPRNAMRDVVAELNHLLIMPAILIHGQKDPVVRPINLVQLTEQFRELNRLSSAGDQSVSVTVTEKPGGPRTGNAYKASEYYLGNKLILKVCEISQLDHAWSGGDGTVRFSEDKGPDASKLMWDFFVKHKRVSDVSGSLPVRLLANAKAIWESLA